MPTFAYRLLNVFVRRSDPLTGNPLCVFEDAREMSSSTMQALALQFNLSETAFILPSQCASARVRIFTPTFEMPFAGHPVLGTAHAVRDLLVTNRVRADRVTLEVAAGIIPVSADRNRWTLRANAPSTSSTQWSNQQLANMLGLQRTDMGEPALWVDTGNKQLLVPLKSTEALEACHPSSELLQRYGCVHEGRYVVYVFAQGAAGQVHARFFFCKGTTVVEDPATGSACANLGGYLSHIGASRPIRRAVEQGRHVGRPSLLHLEVDEQQRSRVSGEVLELGRGTVHLP